MLDADPSASRLLVVSALDPQGGGTLHRWDGGSEIVEIADVVVVGAW